MQFNSFQLNTQQFNGFQLFNPSATDKIIFNNFSLQSSQIHSSVVLKDNTPIRDFQSTAVPRGDGEIINGDFWRRKIIHIEGTIVCADAVTLETTIDNMKKALAVSQANLDIKNTSSGAVRRFVCTLISGDSMFAQRKNFHVSFCPFSFDLLCLTPFGQDVNYTSNGWLDQTTLVLNDVVQNDGTVHAKPVIIVNFSAASGITAVQFKNNTRGESILVTRSFVASDYLQIDFEQMLVTVNGTSVDYSGVFPFLDVGVNSFTLILTGTSATYTLTEKHKICYL